MLSKIKSLFGREKGLSREQVAAVGQVAAGQRPARLGGVLHELCVKTAADFVQEEHQRPDSPFGKLRKSDLFHEMLVINFWVLETLFKGKRPAVMEQVYRQYSDSFVWGMESSPKELMESIRAKFRTYDKAWDEYSGHQDVFARQVIAVIFGDQNVAGGQQAAFWLIRYADRTMKDFVEVAKSVDLLLREDAGAA